MPKVQKCIYCNKILVTSTYGIIEHIRLKHPRILSSTKTSKKTNPTKSVAHN